MDENNVFDKLIVMDDVSGFADKSDEFDNFLTVSRKFSFTCVYDFHTMHPTRSRWQMVLSQTKIFNIFPGSSQTASVTKILSSYCKRYTYKYIPHRDLWLNRLYFKVSNSSEKKCQTIDPEVFSNKTVLFDISKIDEEKVIDRIVENIPGDNDDMHFR